MNVRLLPPVVGPQSVSPVSVFGVSYVPTAAAFIDVTANVAAVLEANGWSRIAVVGPTSARPSVAGTSQAALRGSQYLDLDVGGIVTHDGQQWRDTSGAAV